MEQQNSGAPAPVESQVSDVSESQDVGGQEGGEEIVSSAPTKEEIKRINKIKLKLDGEEIEEELPFDIEENPEVLEYLQRNLQMSKVAHKRMQEKSSLEREVSQFIQLLKDDPIAALSDPAIGHDVKKLAAQIIESEIENAKKTPEQLELEKAQAELKRLKKEREEEEKSRKEQERIKAEKEALERYDQQIEAALSKTKILRNEESVAKMAQYMLFALDNGIELTFDQIAPIVEQEMVENLRKYTESLDDEAFEEFTGKERLSRIRKKNIQKIKSKPKVENVSSIKDVGKVTKKEAEAEPSKKSIKDFFGV